MYNILHNLILIIIIYSNFYSIIYVIGLNPSSLDKNNGSRLEARAAALFNSPGRAGREVAQDSGNLEVNSVAQRIALSNTLEVNGKVKDLSVSVNSSLATNNFGDIVINISNFA